MDNCSNSRANTCIKARLFGRAAFIRYRTIPCIRVRFLVNHDKNVNRKASAVDKSSKCLTYQRPTVGYWPTVALTGNGELGFDSGEGA